MCVTHIVLNKWNHFHLVMLFPMPLYLIEAFCYSLALPCHCHLKPKELIFPRLETISKNPLRELKWEKKIHLQWTIIIQNGGWWWWGHKWMVLVLEYMFVCAAGNVLIMFMLFWWPNTLTSFFSHRHSENQHQLPMVRYSWNWNYNK